MTSCTMAPSHYLKQCGLIIKLINKVLWHLYQWIIIKHLKIPISKMILKLLFWNNFTSSPEIIYFILFSNDNSFVLCHGGKLIFIVTIFNPSDCCLLKGNKQRVLMHGHQGWNVRHASCVRFTWDMYIYIYIHIYELFIAFVSFVVCSLL